MKPFVTDRKTKQAQFRNYPIKNRGKVGKRRAVIKWRSRKGARRKSKSVMNGGVAGDALDSDAY